MSFVIIQPAIHAMKLVEMVRSFHSTVIRFPFCMNKPQPLFLSLIDFTACSYFYVQCKDSNSDHHEGLQSRTRKEKKKDSCTHVRNFLPICLSDLVPLEHPVCSPVFAGINMSFMQTSFLYKQTVIYYFIGVS